MIKEPTFKEKCYTLTIEEWLALWGCESCYDHPPLEKGDGAAFYDYSIHKDDKTFILTKMLPAIERQLKCEMETKDRENMLICRDFITKRYLNGELDSSDF